jgi:hypothetical protein
MTRSPHPPISAGGHRVRFVETWPEDFFEVNINLEAEVKQFQEPAALAEKCIQLIEKEIQEKLIAPRSASSTT